MRNRRDIVILSHTAASLPSPQHHASIFTGLSRVAAHQTASYRRGLKKYVPEKQKTLSKISYRAKIPKGKTDGKTTSSSKYLGPNPTTTMQSIHRQKTT